MYKIELADETALASILDMQRFHEQLSRRFPHVSAALPPLPISLCRTRDYQPLINPRVDLPTLGRSSFDQSEEAVALYVSAIEDHEDGRACFIEWLGMRGQPSDAVKSRIKVTALDQTNMTPAREEMQEQYDIAMPNIGSNASPEECYWGMMQKREDEGENEHSWQLYHVFVGNGVFEWYVDKAAPQGSIAVQFMHAEVDDSGCYLRVVDRGNRSPGSNPMEHEFRCLRSYTMQDSEGESIEREGVADEDGMAWLWLERLATCAPPGYKAVRAGNTIASANRSVQRSARVPQITDLGAIRAVLLLRSTEVERKVEELHKDTLKMEAHLEELEEQKSFLGLKAASLKVAQEHGQQIEADREREAQRERVTTLAELEHQHHEQQHRTGQARQRREHAEQQAMALCSEWAKHKLEIEEQVRQANVRLAQKQHECEDVQCAYMEKYAAVHTQCNQEAPAQK